MNARTKMRISISGIILILGIIIIIYYVFPIKHKMDEVIPAVVIMNDSNTVKCTNLIVNGTWTSRKSTYIVETYIGSIDIEILKYYTDMNIWNSNLKLTFDESKQIFSGGIFYNGNTGVEASGWLYTNRNHEKYVIIISPKENASNNWIVIAPAHSIDEAYMICDEMNLKIPLN